MACVSPSVCVGGRRRKENLLLLCPYKLSLWTILLLLWQGLLLEKKNGNLVGEEGGRGTWDWQFWRRKRRLVEKGVKKAWELIRKEEEQIGGRKLPCMYMYMEPVQVDRQKKKAMCVCVCSGGTMAKLFWDQRKAVLLNNRPTQYAVY